MAVLQRSPRLTFIGMGRCADEDTQDRFARGPRRQRRNIRFESEPAPRSTTCERMGGGDVAGPKAAIALASHACDHRPMTAIPCNITFTHAASCVDTE
jgi:hypothetical protein